MARGIWLEPPQSDERGTALDLRARHPVVRSRPLVDHALPERNARRDAFRELGHADLAVRRHLLRTVITAACIGDPALAGSDVVVARCTEPQHAGTVVADLRDLVRAGMDRAIHRPCHRKEAPVLFQGSAVSPDRTDVAAVERLPAPGDSLLIRSSADS